MKEAGNFSPQAELEMRASVYKIIPHKSSRKNLVLFYNNEATLRWSLNENGNIKLWHSEDALHHEADYDGYQADTTGYISKRHGITYSDIRLFDDKKKAEIIFALQKYLTKI